MEYGRSAGQKDESERMMEYQERIKWFQDARFGMFIHFGPYAEAGRGEWVRSDERLGNEAYQEYVERFTPDAFDADKIAALAAEAGMKYAVMTAKHHDGFCMFDSELTDYRSVRYTGRDYVREFLDACRRKGLRAGLYYSLLDWHHPEYPAYGDPYHPCRDDPSYAGRTYDFDRYLDYMHGQIRELCTKYGRIDILWTDFSYPGKRADAWRGEELVRMVRSLQPHIILNNRLEASGEGFGSLLEEKPDITSGDFVSPEQIIPPGGIRNKNGEPVCWEACVTMNGHWGYCRGDEWFKPADMLVRKLVECVSKGGNLLLNIGPDEKGNVPEEEERILREIGKWMRVNGESVYGCGIAPVGKPEYGRVTAREGCLYYHVTEAQIGGIPLPGIRREEIASVSLLCGRPVTISDSWITANYPHLVYADLGEDPVLPDAADTVIKVVLKK